MTFLFKLEHLYILLLTIYHLRPGCLGYDPEASITGLYTGPYFDPLAPKNLTAHLGDRAVLPCTVRQLGDKSVSWVRMRDADILTVDRYTFVSDERFEAHYSPPQETWNLIIKYVQERDAGQYECQVSTEPKMSQLFNLRVVVPRVSMEPPEDRYVKAGSKVRIDCQITDVVQQPDYIFWYHDGIRVLENQDDNLAVIVMKTGEESMVSSLTISRVRREESGNYTCMPSNLHSSSVLLHVLNEEHPEAMKDGRNASCKMEQPIYLFLLFVLCTALSHLFSDSSLPNTNSRAKRPLDGKPRYQLAYYHGHDHNQGTLGRKVGCHKLSMHSISPIFFRSSAHNVTPSIVPKLMQTVTLGSDLVAMNENSTEMNVIKKAIEQILFEPHWSVRNIKCLSSQIKQEYPLTEQSCWSSTEKLFLYWAKGKATARPANEGQTKKSACVAKQLEDSRITKGTIEQQEFIMDMESLKEGLSMNKNNQKTKGLYQQEKIIRKLREIVNNSAISCPATSPRFLISSR